LNKTDNDLVHVSDEFIKENKKANFTKHNKKNGGPYTKSDRQQRQDEVYRLHFEYGYSARQIADMMQISRNTINSDINLLYQKLSQHWENTPIEAWLSKQITRLELQRTRLLSELEKQKTLQDKMCIEKMIFDIDSRILNTVTKTHNQKQDGFRDALDAINTQSEKKNRELQKKSKSFFGLTDEEKEEQRHLIGFTSTDGVYRVKLDTAEKINKLIRQDKNVRMGKF